MTVRCRLAADVTAATADDDGVTLDTVPFGTLTVATDRPDLVLALRDGADEAALAPVADILARLIDGRLVEWLATADDGTILAVVEARDSGFAPAAAGPLPPGAVLSRFAYFHRAGAGLVLDSAAVPARARLDPVRLHDAAVAGLLWRCGFLVAPDAAEEPLWSLHDRLFHAMTRFGRDAEALGALDPGRGIIPPPPALAPLPDGQVVPLPEPEPAAASPLARRRSGRDWSQAAVPLAALSALLRRALGLIEEMPAGPDGLVRLRRPYPSGGALSALVAELAVDRVEGLAPGFYRYDEAGHPPPRSMPPRRRRPAGGPPWCCAWTCVTTGSPGVMPGCPIAWRCSKPGRRCRPCRWCQPSSDLPPASWAPAPPDPDWPREPCRSPKSPLVYLDRRKICSFRSIRGWQATPNG